MARLSVSFDDIWANVDLPDQITLGKQISFTKTTNSPGDIGIALSIYSPDIYLMPDAQGPGIDRHRLPLQIDFSATSTSFSVPLSSWSQVTNKNKIAFQIEATAVTTSGVGTTARTTVYAVADQSMAPTFTLGVSPSSGVIQGITPVVISISGESCKYGASVASRSINADGRSSGGSSLSITPISNGTIAISATVKDSRGLSTTKTATFNVTAYSPPSLSSFKVSRVDSSGSPDAEGTSVKFSVVWVLGTGDTGGNSCTVKYRQAGAASYTDLGAVVSGEERIITDEVFFTDYEYEFIATVTDKHTPLEKQVILDRGFFTLDFKKGGDGMAIGQACTEPGLTINMPSIFKKAITLAEDAKNSLLNYFAAKDHAHNECIAPERYLNNALLVDASPDHWCSRPCLVVKDPGAGITAFNLPAALESASTVMCVRMVQIISSKHIAVWLYESFPYGRLWTNFYNCGQWDGWRQI